MHFKMPVTGLVQEHIISWNGRAVVMRRHGLSRWGEDMPDILRQLGLHITELILRYLKVGSSHDTGTRAHH